MTAPRAAPDTQPTSPAAAAAPAAATARRRLPRWLLRAALLLAALGLWYGGIGTWRAGIDADLGLRPSAEQRPPGSSATLAIAARLLEHQVEDRAFTPNDPIFYPTGLARRTPAFQAAAVETVAAVVRARAAEGGNDGLATAATELETPPTQWWLGTSWPVFGLPAERHYRRARLALESANHNIAARTSGTFAASPRDRRTALQALQLAIDSEVARGDALVKNPRAASVPVQIARARGTAYAAALLLRGLNEDSAAAVRDSGRAARWGEAIDALDSVAGLDPLLPSDEHLVRAGYALMIASNALRAIQEGER